MALTKIDDRGLKTPIDLLDNEKIRFGTDIDLQIYSDNSNAIITAAGAGDLQLISRELRKIEKLFCFGSILQSLLIFSNTKRKNLAAEDCT